MTSQMKPYYEHNRVSIFQGHIVDILQGMPDESVHCVVTSPPYWGLRDYGIEPQVWDGRYKGHCRKIIDGREVYINRHEWGEEAYKKSSQDTVTKLSG